MDFVEVLRLLHKDEPFVRWFTQLHYRLPSALTDALQKFCNHASSGNSVIYNCSKLGLCGRKILFATPYSYISGEGLFDYIDAL